MYMIVILHMLNRGGIYGKEVSGSGRVCDLVLLSFVFSCVDCYALISGFVGYRENKYTRNTVNFMVMWCQTVFYGLIITLIMSITGVCTADLYSYLSAMLPLTENQYWYFTAYFGVFLCAPFINMAIDRMSSSSALPVCTGIILFFSVLPYMTDLFELYGGYNSAWLILLYIVGALLKKDGIYRSFNNSTVLVILLIAFTALNFAVGMMKNPDSAEVFRYTDPLVLADSIVLLLLFANAKVGKAMQKAAEFTAPAVFGVFLIHTQKKLFASVFSTAFLWIADLPSVLPALAVLGCSAVILIACILVDKLRIKLFELIKLRKIAEIFYSVLHDKYQNITAKLLKR